MLSKFLVVAQSLLTSLLLSSGYHNALEPFQTYHASEILQHGVVIAANATVLERAGQWVSVSWAGVKFPTYDDYIALYPAAGDVDSVAPIKFKLAATAARSHLRLGSGNTSFRLLNMRQAVRFALLRGGLERPSVAAWSDSLTLLHPNEPTQGHLTVTATPGQVAVQWTTRDRDVNPTVQWGTAPGALTATATADAVDSSVTYERSQMCGAPANGAGWMDPGWFHHVVLPGLQPGQRYWYRYGDGQRGVWSEEASFVGPPLPGAHQSVRILAVADLGQAEVDGSLEHSEMSASLATTRALHREVDAWAPQLLVHNGDVSYARGFSSQWDVYWDQLAHVVRSMPYATAPGNHERDWPGSGDRFGWSYDSGGECGVAYEARTRMPQGNPKIAESGTAAKNTASGRAPPNDSPPPSDRPWYSFDFGPVHLLQYSTEHDFYPGSPQHAFIAADLGAVDRQVTPWVVVGGHRPIYLDSVAWSPLVKDGDQIVAAQLRASLEPLLLQHGVDVTWHGHHHSYQRTCAVAGERCVVDINDAGDSAGTPSAPVHVVIGHAGAGISPNIHLFRPRIFESVELIHGYIRVEANATHMTHQAVDSLSGEVFDEFVLAKPRKKEAGRGGKRAAVLPRKAALAR